MHVSLLGQSNIKKIIITWSVHDWEVTALRYICFPLASLWMKNKSALIDREKMNTNLNVC